MATDRPRFTVSLGDELYEQVEAFRIKNRYSTRSKAVEALIDSAIADLIASGKMSETPPPPTDTLTADIERFARTLTGEQVEMLVSILTRAAGTVRGARDTPRNVHDMSADEIRAEVDRQLAEEAADREKGTGTPSTGSLSASGEDCG